MSALLKTYQAMRDRMGDSAREYELAFSATHSGYPHVEWSNGKYAFVSTDRGLEVSRDWTDDADELLYWQFDFLIGELSSRYAAGDESFRKRYFARQLELFGKLKSEWRERKAWEIAQLLAAQGDAEDNPVDQSEFSSEKRGANRIILVVIGLVGLVLAVAAHLPLFNAVAEQRALASHGVEDQGTVLSLRESHLRFGRTYALTYCVVIDGQRRDVHESVSASRFALTGEGDQIAVRYLPDDTTTVGVVGNDSAGRLGTIYAVIDLLILLALWWNWREIKRAVGRLPEPSAAA